MGKVEKLKELLKTQMEVRGTRHRFYPDRVEANSFSGLTVFIENDSLVFANWQKQQPLSEEVIKEIADDRYVTIFTRDEDGPIEITLDLN
ncbi:hypothetical protein HMSSN036_51960 [Paenibacillus macerans]|nr:hypothetical protein HMSSN036_51960 [Paenibacillus macerans]